MHDHHPTLPSAALVPLLACFLAPGLAAQQQDKVDFLRDIAPIFKAHCFECHGAEEQEADLRLDKKAGLFVDSKSSWVVIPGDPKKSELMFRITLPGNDEDVMPPEGGPLKKDQIEVIRRWIAQGAPWPAEADAAIAKMVSASKPKIEKIELPALTDAQKVVEAEAITAIDKAGGLAMRVAANTTASEVNFSLLGKKATNEQLALAADLQHTLVRLNLARTRIDDAGLAAVGKMPHLRWLNLSNTGVGDAGLAHLAGLENLRYLNLYGTKVTDQGLARLHGLKSLRKVFVWQTAVTAAGAAALQKAVPGVQVDRGEYAKVLAKIQPPAKKKAPVAINKKCPVTGKPVAAGKNVSYQGQLVGLCCNKCVNRFKKDPEKFIPKVAGFKVAKGTTAVNKACPVSNKPVAAGKISAFRGEVIGFCCNKCKAAFDKNPDKYLGKLAVFAKGKKKIVKAPANKACPVSGKPVDAAQTSPYQGRLIGFCCAKCKKSFDKNPAKYRDKLAGVFEK